MVRYSWFKVIFKRVKGNDTQKTIKNTQKIIGLKNKKNKINDTQKVENYT
jgi:hypothetical protein